VHSTPPVGLPLNPLPPDAPHRLLGRTCPEQTNVVTAMAAGRGWCSTTSRFGVREVGAVPPQIVIGAVAAAVPLLMATMTTVPAVL
jgi:hypothetical protein